MKAVFNDIWQWCKEMCLVFRSEMGTIFSDIGAMIFFFLLPISYPVIYSLIYNPEVTRDMPVAVVDNSRTARSREFVRHADATEAMKICGYAADMEEARRWMAEKKCFAILEIPRDYTQKLGRGEQPQIQFYVEMSLLLRYRTFSSSLAELQIATGAQLRQTLMDDLGMPSNGAPSGIRSDGYALGDVTQGFASFIIPGIVVLIMQQSMLLGIVLLGGTRQEQRRRLRGYLPAAPAGGKPLEFKDTRLWVDALSPSAQVMGRAMAVTLIYFPVAIYCLHFVLHFFHYPHAGSFADYLIFILPMLLASAMLGQTLVIMASERESTFIIVVFTSLGVLFLSGLTWPLYAMPPFFRMLADMIPCTWGLQGFIHINSNSGALPQASTPYYCMWGLMLFYFITAWLVTRWQTRVTTKPHRGFVESNEF